MRRKAEVNLIPDSTPLLVVRLGQVTQPVWTSVSLAIKVRVKMLSWGFVVRIKLNSIESA